MYLDSGKLINSGDPAKVCTHYVNKAMLRSKSPATSIHKDRHDESARSGNGKARIRSVSFENNKSSFEFGSRIILKIRIVSFAFLEKLDFGITIFDKTGNAISYTDSRLETQNNLQFTRPRACKYKV